MLHYAKNVKNVLKSAQKMQFPKQLITAAQNA